MRGIVGDKVQFMIEVPTTKIGWDDIASSGAEERVRQSRRSDNYLSGELMSGPNQMCWTDLENREAEVLQIAAQFMRPQNQIDTVTSTRSSQ